MNKILWISFRVPYDGVAHAGGKIHNYYLKELKKSDRFDIKLISFFNDSDIGKIDLDKYGINNELINSTHIENGKTNIVKCIDLLYRICGFNNYLDIITKRMCSAALERIMVLKENGYVPDVIILQWTQMIALTTMIRKVFPDSKIVSIEEDVTFLASKRRLENTDSLLKRIYFKLEYKNVLRFERKCLEMSNLVVLNNKKDDKLLYENGFNVRTWVWTPYFQNMTEFERKPNASKNVLFYGAMNRPENWKSVMWFIENVWSSLKDRGFNLVVIGNKPPKELQAFHGIDNIYIEGFVENIQPYFEEGLCLVAPLVLGAGVKIKILEAMSSGIPVLTNDIGIEGIPAIHGKEFFYCCKPQDYVDYVLKLTKDMNCAQSMSFNAKNFIKENYNYESDAITFATILEDVIKR